MDGRSDTLAHNIRYRLFARAHRSLHSRLAEKLATQLRSHPRVCMIRSRRECWLASWKKNSVRSNLQAG